MKLNQITSLSEHSFKHRGKRTKQNAMCSVAVKRQRMAVCLTMENGIKYRTTLTKYRVSGNSLPWPSSWENMAPYRKTTLSAAKRKENTQQHECSKFQAVEILQLVHTQIAAAAQCMMIPPVFWLVTLWTLIKQVYVFRVLSEIFNCSF